MDWLFKNIVKLWTNDVELSVLYIPIYACKNIYNLNLIYYSFLLISQKY